MADEGWTLADLRHHYGDAYRVDVRGGRWRAERRDGKGEPLVAETAAALVALIREDYRRDPVRRDVR